MKHYNIEEWNEFKSNNLDMDLVDEMQLHLAGCDDCMNLYLSIMDNDDIENAAKDLPDNFTDQIINKIKLEDYRINTIKKKTYYTNMMICYVSAACITLVLMSTGVFHSLLSNVPAVSSVLKDNTSKSEQILTNGWTDQLTQKTSLFLNGLLNSNRRDSFEK